MTVQIRLAQSGEEKEWDAIIAKSPHGSIFHHWNWLKITEKHTQTTLYPLIGMKDDIPIGVFPLFLQKNGPLRMVFSPPPHAALFYLGPVLVGYETMKQEKREINYLALQKSVEQYINNELHAQYVSISLTPGLQDPRPFIWAGYQFKINYDYVIDLTHSQESLLQDVDRKQRQNLSRAKKRGISVELGGKQEYEHIINLMEIRYGEQGKSVTTPKKYLLEIYDVFKEHFRVFIAKKNNEIVTGSIDFQYKDTHYSWIGNPKPKQLITPSPNDLLIWESIRFAKETGMKYYVTMNAAGNERLHTYYATKFNPSLEAHFLLKRTTLLTSLLEVGYSHFFKTSFFKRQKNANLLNK
jgi:hypothetical protein